MKHLGRIQASPEQLKLFSTNQTGAELIRGAAGSGKTTTALLRLTSLANMMRARKDRMGDESPVRVLLLTFNRTLSGYIKALAEAQIVDASHQIKISTFAKWAKDNLEKAGLEPKLEPKRASNMLRQLASEVPELEVAYVMQEVEYLLGRFEPEKIEDYIGAERTGRGVQPRVDVALRRNLLDKVAYPYLEKLDEKGWVDWNRLAIKMLREVTSLQYDIVVVDESQDFSANQIRAISHHLADYHSITFVIDTAQRIYARGFSWVEAGINVAGNRSHGLHENHRNTKETAAFASGILQGLSVDSDGVLPDLNAANTTGPLPVVLTGKYSQQLDWALGYIDSNVDLARETVAFLKPEGGQWFSYIKNRLTSAGIGFVEMQQNAEWPEGSENVAISTFHSAKGLEYDHVIILGFNQENTRFGDEDRSDQIQVLRRLLAVAVARARRQVVVGYKPGEESRLTDFFRAGTFSGVAL